MARFHRYGPVEIAIEAQPLAPEGEQADFRTLARRNAESAEFELAETGRIEIDESEPMAGPQPVEDWRDLSSGAWLDRSEDSEGNWLGELFDAAARLAWAEFEEFQAADRLMGDPYP